MTDEALRFATLTDLGDLYRRREVSPVEVVDVLLAQIDAVNAQALAYITVLSDRARSEAQAAEKLLMANDDPPPLLGIPIALKDLVHTAGVRTTSGAKALADFVPQTSATVARKLASAGAVLLGKTNMTELAFDPFGINPHYGTPPNPWGADRVPGGSSSGSGVAVALGIAAAALGTDTGGSIRIPASHCGIVGLKPTLERVSRAGVTPLSWTLDSVGPMTRSVEDAARVFSVIAGPDQNDPVTLSQPEMDVSRLLKRDVQGMRVGLVRDPFFDGADSAVVQAVEQVAEVFVDRGVEVVEMAFPEAREEMDARDILTIMPVEGYASHRDLVEKHGKEMDDRIRKRLLSGAGISAPDYAHILQKREILRRKACDTLCDVDAAICPTMLTPAPRIADADTTTLHLTTRLINFLGLCAVSVPCGLSEGLPIGLQVIGKPFEEAAILRLAFAYEQATDWHMLRPPTH